MCGCVYFFQFLECGVRVYLRRRHTFMAEQFLHALKSSTMIEHRRGESMAQYMRRAFLLGTYTVDILLHSVSHGITIHSAPLNGHK